MRRLAVAVLVLACASAAHAQTEPAYLPALKEALGSYCGPWTAGAEAAALEATGRTKGWAVTDNAFFAKGQVNMALTDLGPARRCEVYVALPAAPFDTAPAQAAMEASAQALVGGEGQSAETRAGAQTLTLVRWTNPAGSVATIYVFPSHQPMGGDVGLRIDAPKAR